MLTVMLDLNILIIIHRAHQWMDINISSLLTALLVNITIYQMGKFTHVLCSYMYVI